MSYFRSVGDVSESGDLSVSHNVPSRRSNDEDSSGISRVRTIASGSGSENQHELSSAEAFSPSSAPASFHSNALLHALLEERCMVQAMAKLQTQGHHVDSINDPKVRELGYKRYSQTIQSLTDLNVVKPGIDNLYYGQVRQGYRDAVDLLGDPNTTATRPGIHKAASQMELQLPPALRRYHEAAPRFPDDIRHQLGMMTLGDSRQDAFNIPSHKLLETKYVREFEEFSVLGKGGYGVVFHVKNKLDGGTYAIKKIPVSGHRLRKIHENGALEMDQILLELRTLAKLHHPNVVRYHSGWIEHATFSTPSPARRGTVRNLLALPEKEQEQSFGADTQNSSVDIQFEFDDEDDVESSSGWGNTNASAANDDDLGIVFGEDTEHSNDDDQNSVSLSANASYSENPLEKMRSRSTLASVDDEIEDIPRNDNMSPTSDSNSSALSENEGLAHEPCLALHIQMSLYSMTLSEFLSPSNGDLDSSAITSLRHCFHPSSSLPMLLAIMSGVKYLHKEGIVHRDLKPGNIFLAVRPGSDCPPGAIDLALCGSCNDTATPRPFNMDLCLGDFGLVSAIAKEEDEIPATPSRIVGTEIYRPESITRDNHPSLDVFALGIIAFELVWKFDTRMERHETLHTLKKGKLPPGFDEKVGCPGMEKFILSMVMASETCCPTWEILRSQALALIKT